MFRKLKIAGYPVIVNLLVIIVIAALGVVIVYLGLGVFTRHGQTDQVPGVENMSYTDAVRKLQDAGFKVEIRDSIFAENVRPGYVVEQFPKSGSTVKPGRKIFLYINAVNPKQVIIDDENRPSLPAMANISQRTALSRLSELGFRNIKVVKVLSVDRGAVIKITANGKIVRKMEKVPVNASIIIEVGDGELENVLQGWNGEEVETGSYEYEENEFSEEEQPYYPEPAPEPIEEGSTEANPGMF